jgi:hypothetical protein
LSWTLRSVAAALRSPCEIAERLRGRCGLPSPMGDSGPVLIVFDVMAQVDVTSVYFF